ncbi:hypothetical protein [Psychroserpens algicola]|uniref:hypothetical protein n=1 Tax=Psychroserpens algicola TaxID=1719034 RepID=UPI001953261A|nr:hypothetical protein [Psychroserpens algicola]
MSINFELAETLGYESGFEPPTKLSVAERVEIVNKKRFIEAIKKAMNNRSRYFSHLKKKLHQQGF